jgi:hypothetical protein
MCRPHSQQSNSSLPKKAGILSSILGRVGKHLGDLPFVAELAGLGAECLGATHGTFDSIPLFAKAPQGSGVDEEQRQICRNNNPTHLWRPSKVSFGLRPAFRLRSFPMGKAQLLWPAAPLPPRVRPARLCAAVASIG